MEKYYKISESELLSLLEDANELRALESSGVDNWVWYGEHREDKEENTTSEELPSLYDLV